MCLCVIRISHITLNIYKFLHVHNENFLACPCKTLKSTINLNINMVIQFNICLNLFTYKIKNIYIYIFEFRDLYDSINI